MKILDQLRSIPRRVKWWLNGHHTCIRCERIFYRLGSFGYGFCICPNCFKDEQPFMWTVKEWMEVKI